MTNTGQGVPGAGRKPGSKNKKTLEREKHEAALREVIFGEAQELVKLHLDIAKKKKDWRAIDALFDRAFGKPKQQTDVTSDGEKIESGVVYMPTKNE